MLHSYLDHIVITAASLQAGVEFVEQTLGVRLQTGGKHPRMGTHNCLLKLGEKLYLEVIAVDPDALKPRHPRWFQLDRIDYSQSIRLATWVARTNDVKMATTVSPMPLGKIESMSRGPLNWLITIPEDGSLPLKGIVPTLIQWPDSVHPATLLPESGCALVKLEGFYPEPNQVLTILKFIGFEDRFDISALAPGREPYLAAHIQTPTGLRILGG
ncbi:VOC family protein [Methylomonas sp. MgM2]